jgi:hypothetical protein
MDIHYYLLCYRLEALVASHLEPEAFGHYMAVGTQKLSRGNVIFAEIDPGLKSDYFQLSEIRQRCVPRPDGSPKRSKYISIYRVLEHLETSVIGKLYLTTADGKVLGLNSADYDAGGEVSGPHMYQELCPVSPQVVSSLAPAAFSKFMTDSNNAVSVPRLFFADLLLDQDEFGNLAGYLPYSEPMHIRACLNEVKNARGKPTKTVDRTPAMNAFYRTIRRGFFVGDQQGLKFYPYPPLRELEVQHAHWWRSASAS